jgi:YihY family inner membrane protein
MAEIPQAAPNVPTVAEAMTQEARRKRRRIAASLWPRARLFVEVMRYRINEEETFEQAAAMTYKTLFSLIPVFVLSLLVLSAISASPHRVRPSTAPAAEAADGGGHGVEAENTALDATVKRLVFEQLSLDRFPLTTNDGQPVRDAAGKEVMLSDFIAPLVDRARSAVTNKATGVIAFGILAYGAISLMIVIEGAFNQIYGSVKARSWPRRIMLYWCVLTLGPIFMGASIALGQAASSTAQSLAPVARLVSPAQALSAFAISWLLIFLMFKLIPDTLVAWRSALLGSFVSAVLWEVGKWGFGLYVAHSVKGSWYGSLGLIPLFMLWIYLTWTMVLLGLHVAYIHQYYPMLKRQFFYTRHCAVQISDIRWVFSLGILLYRRFREGKTMHPANAAEMLLLPTDVTGQLLDGLRVAGLVHRVADGGYSLARPPESITAFDLLTAARALCQLPPELAKEHGQIAPLMRSEAMDELDRLEGSWARTHTLPALAGEKPAP